VSSLRLRARVARREHEHILIIRPCKRCGEPFQHCRGCEPGRLYCLACSPLASRERERKAHKTYYRSDEGREQHHYEEHERRKRRRWEARQQVLQGGRDRRCAPEDGRLQVVASASRSAGEEPSDGPVPEHRGIEQTSVLGTGTAEGGNEEANREVGTVEWTVVAWPGCAAAARRLLETEVACPFCGRSGVVRRVLTLDQWRRLGRARGARWKQPP
jgi:hypothetical protein